jgi:hypothetical protein
MNRGGKPPIIIQGALESAVPCQSHSICPYYEMVSLVTPQRGGRQTRACRLGRVFRHRGRRGVVNAGSITYFYDSLGDFVCQELAKFGVTRPAAFASIAEKAALH